MSQVENVAVALRYAGPPLVAPVVAPWSGMGSKMVRHLGSESKLCGHSKSSPHVNEFNPMFADVGPTLAALPPTSSLGPTQLQLYRSIEAESNSGRFALNLDVMGI